MREMKDSGVEWIGKIPKDWEIVPLTKQLDSIVDYRGKTPEKTEEGTFLVTAKNIKDGKICYELSKEYVREADYEEIMHRGIPQIGDILFTTEAPLGQVANVDRTDIALAQRIIKFRALSTVNNYYLKHWIEDIVWEMNTDEEDTTSEVRSSSKDKRNKGFIAHIDKLRSYLDAPEEIHLGRKPEDLLETLVNMVLGSPAICIYRSNGRSTARATSLAKVFVNNFNLPESTAIIDLAYGRCRDDNSHWQNVLKYCKDGCFQAMIDEYIHMLKETAGFQSDGNQYQIVHDMMMDSLKIHTATYIADTYPDFKKRINGADRKSDGCRIRSSYAVGFTKDAGDNSKVVMRKENIRNAFNSPMRPFVLATTSIGQEGLDFHNYCRVIMHWNLPSNPIDVGRILRTFKIKKNVEVTDNGKIII